ncbi:putative nicotinamide N-methyase [Rhizomicrobium palustre]|jgi:predicted nicotinamide N-methyase|uniref:Putative nicotinamide N-methyase n=1 Tax=Rhizomicrobium palustre TaxID=189966 RepID=A0A846N0C7_9PROT|nr:50S ribosomal protein L11 methyltransferase [Rhizomicrobium palustre]NIK89328.1 putative nicotinamide N-methyase [Rhizomicrobium palustre]
MTDPLAFVRATTELETPPLVPEIRLHLANEVLPLWRKTEEELAQEGVAPPYWAFAWAGGQALARYVLDHADEIGVKGASVLDFGAGSGLVAIAAAKAGAAKVLAADIDPFAAAAMVVNAKDNGVVLGTTCEDVIGHAGSWTLILVGDMCYERPLAERLLAWLTAETKAGATVLIGDPGRNYFPKSGITKLATYEVPTSRDLEDRDMRVTSVYRLTP